MNGELTLPAIRPSRRISVIIGLILSTVILAMGVAGYSVYTVGQDRNGWREVARTVTAQNTELREQNTVQAATLACRSQSNLDTDKASAELQIVIGRGLAAVARDEPLAGYLDDLNTAIANLRKALDIRQVALSTCSTPEVTP